MKYGIKVNRPEVINGKQIHNWRSQYLIVIQEDNSSHLYKMDEYLSDPTARPLHIVNTPVFYDIRSDIYLTVNKQHKSIDISRDFVSWTRWRPAPSNLLEEGALYTLSHRFQAVYNKQTKGLELYEAPNLNRVLKTLDLPGEPLGLQILDYDAAFLYPLKGQVDLVVSDALVRRFPELESVNLNILPDFTQYNDLYTTTGVEGDVRYLPETQKWYVYVDSIMYGQGINSRWWKVSPESLKDPINTPPDKDDRIFHYHFFDTSVDGVTTFLRGEFDGLYNDILPKPGRVYCALKSSGGFRLYVNETLILDKWEEEQGGGFNFDFFHPPGLPARIRVEYYHKDGQQFFTLFLRGVRYEDSEQDPPPPAVFYDYDPRRVNGIIGSYLTQPMHHWLNLEFTEYLFLPTIDQALIRSNNKVDIVVFYSDKTILIEFIPGFSVDVLPRIAYLDYLYPEPFSSEGIKKDTIRMIPPALQGAPARTKYKNSSPCIDALGPEQLYHRENPLYSKAVFKGLWSDGVKSLVPVDPSTGKSVLFNSKSVSNYFITDTMRHIEVFADEGIRLPRHNDNHTHDRSQIWQEAIPHVDQQLDLRFYESEIFLPVTKRKRVRYLNDE